MNNKMYATVRNVTNRVTNWLGRHSLQLVLIMSLLHVGLAYIHTRDSGRADPLTNFLAAVRSSIDKTPVNLSLT